MANNTKIPAHRAGEVSSKVRVVRRETTPWGGSKGKQALSYYDEEESQGDSQTMALCKRKVPSSQDDSGVDFHHALNAKQSRGEGDLQAKLVVKATSTARSILFNEVRGQDPEFCSNITTPVEVPNPIHV